MELKRDIFFSIAVLVVLNLALAFGSIGLFSRMGPAIDLILRENMYSIEAAEVMLATLAASKGALTEEEQIRFEANMKRLRRNITEDAEIPLVANIEADGESAVEGDQDARLRTIDALMSLVAINREAMNAVDHTARRMGTAGAWSAVFIGAFSFFVSILVLRHLYRRIFAPMRELYDVLTAVHAGDRFRRCRELPAPLEIKRALATVNRLLDGDYAGASTLGDTSPALRPALLNLLETLKAPAVVTDPNGGMVAGNRAALAMLSEDSGEGLRKTWTEWVRSRVFPSSVRAVALNGDKGWLLTFRDRDGGEN